MSANPKFLEATAHVDDAAVHPLPNSRKVHITGSRPDLRVPMREITQAETPATFGAEKNPPLYVYDTSGAYTDPAARIDIRAGLAPLRERWIRSAATPRCWTRLRPSSAGSASPTRSSPSCASTSSACRAAPGTAPA